MLQSEKHYVSAKHWFIRTALSYLGTPYIWGGDDPSGFDCSGFVVECLKSVGLLSEREDYTANGLMALFNRTDDSAEVDVATIADGGFSDAKIASDDMTGQLMFRFGADGKANHVVICLDRWFQIGASGGGAGNVSREVAWATNAFIKIRRIGESRETLKFVDPFVRLKG